MKRDFLIIDGTLIVIIGSTLGAIMGPYIFHMIANPSRIYYYTFPYWNSIQFIEIAIIIPFMAVLSLLVSYYSIKNNPYIYYNYKIFVAEVASQVNEIILSRYLIDHTSDKLEKLNILDSLMELFKGSIVRQTMFAEFEKLMHEKEASGEVLTSKFISDNYYELYKKYSGSSMISDPEIRYEWEKIPHFYYNFYVYQYATGLAAASYIASNILEGREGALDKYLKFLTLGGSMDPVDELKVAGVDITDPEVIQKGMDMFKKTIDEFKEIYEK